MKVLFDTNVLYSALGRPEDTTFELKNRANKVIKICDEKAWIKCISIRTQREFEQGWDEKNFKIDRIKTEKVFLCLFELLPYHHGNENWEEVDANWEEDESIFGDDAEYNLAEEIENKLKGEGKNIRRDRGIIIDAIQNECQIIISENWTDFNEARSVAKKYHIDIYQPSDFIEKYK